MKRFLMTFAFLTLALGMTYNALGSSLRHGTSVWYETYNSCCNPFVNDQRHWSVNFDGGQCDGNGRPYYNGSQIPSGEGHWRDGNTWQLTKSWMQDTGCLDWWDCTACSQTTQSCSAYNFTAYCNVY